MPAAPIPASLRAPRHPARQVACPHCHAAPRQPCTTVSGRHHIPDPHPSRVAAWATATACCPACQVTPGVPCHLDGRPLRGGHVHPQRETESRRTTA